jgi:hypothetical protein
MPTIKVGKKYIYRGNTESFKGRLCFIENLLEYENHPTPDAYVDIKFLGEPSIWSVHAGSLREARKKKKKVRV